MAVTVIPNLSLVSSADTAGSEGAWVGNSGGADAEVKIQGAGSYTWQASKNARTTCTFTPTNNLNMSGPDMHLYWWAQNAVASFMEPKIEVIDDPGYTVRLTDGSANYKEWRMAGSDTWGGEWRCFVLDVNDTTDVYASSGVLDLTDIDVISWSVDISNSGQIRIIDNQWNDVVRMGTGLTATGTAFDITDIAADDELAANKYGVLENIDGVIFCQGRLIIGDDVAVTTFNSTDETLVFRDRNANGKGIVSADLYGVRFDGSGCVADVNGLVAKGAGTTDTTRFFFDASDATSTVNINASTFIRAGLIDFSSQDDVQNNVFNNCFQIDPSTSVFTNNSISNYVGTEGGAVIFPAEDTNFKDLVFTNCDNSIEYVNGSDDSSPKFDNIIFDDVSGNYDVYNTSDSTTAISLTNGSNANSYNPAGEVTEFLSSVLLTMTVKDSNGDPINVAYAYIDDDDTPFIMNKQTNASGIASETWTGGSVVGAIWRVRKYGFKPYLQTVDIGGSNISLPVTLISDPQQT